MATKAANDLLHDIATTGHAYEAGDREARQKLLRLCQELTVELEQPGETFLRHNWVEARGSHSRSSMFNVNDFIAYASVLDPYRNRSRHLQDLVRGWRGAKI
jgi:hypothetical protein